MTIELKAVTGQHPAFFTQILTDGKILSGKASSGKEEFDIEDGSYSYLYMFKIKQDNPFCSISTESLGGMAPRDIWEACNSSRRLKTFIGNKGLFSKSFPGARCTLWSAQARFKDHDDIEAMKEAWRLSKDSSSLFFVMSDGRVLMTSAGKDVCFCVDYQRGGHQHKPVHSFLREPLLEELNEFQITRETAVRLLQLDKLEPDALKIN